VAGVIGEEEAVSVGEIEEAVYPVVNIDFYGNQLGEDVGQELPLKRLLVQI
jgi:hypothetical protein